MANQTLSPPRGLRRIWSQLPPPTRRRLIAQVVFLLRPTDSGAMCEPIGYPISAPQPARRRLRAAIDSTPGGTSSGEQASPIPTDRPRQIIRLASPTLPGDRRRSGYLGRPEQQSTGLPAAGVNARPAWSGDRLWPGGLASGSQLPGLVSALGVGRGLQRAHRRRGWAVRPVRLQRP